MKYIIEKNLLDVKQKLEPYTPNIIAVTKYFDYTAMQDAYKAGIRDFGENRVSDAIEKISQLDEEIRKNSRFHLIGHLQKNKVKKAVGAFDLIQSVDSLELAREIDVVAQKKELVQKILIQINNAKEPQKSGFYPEDILRDFGEIIKLKNIKVEGVMNMAPLIEDREKILSLFEEIVQLKKKLETKFLYELKEVSMGMSGDYELAARAGATMIRLGRKLFKEN